MDLLRGKTHVAVSFAGEWSKWSARITSHVYGTKCGAKKAVAEEPLDEDRMTGEEVEREDEAGERGEMRPTTH